MLQATGIRVDQRTFGCSVPLPAGARDPRETRWPAAGGGAGQSSRRPPHRRHRERRSGNHHRPAGRRIGLRRDRDGDAWDKRHGQPVSGLGRHQGDASRRWRCWN